jgi:hypothetical protein
MLQCENQNIRLFGVIFLKLKSLKIGNLKLITHDHRFIRVTLGGFSVKCRIINY